MKMNTLFIICGTILLVLFVGFWVDLGKSKTIKNNGNVGLSNGVPQPNSILYVDSGSIQSGNPPTTRLHVMSFNHIGIGKTKTIKTNRNVGLGAPNPTELLYIASSGSGAVGTTPPNHRLELYADGKIDITGTGAHVPTELHIKVLYMASSQAQTLKFSADFNRLFAIYGVTNSTDY